MSLIQEALRRRQQEQDGTSPPAEQPAQQSPREKPKPLPFPVSIDADILTPPVKNSVDNRQPPLRLKNTPVSQMPVPPSATQPQQAPPRPAPVTIPPAPKAVDPAPQPAPPATAQQRTPQPQQAPQTTAETQPVRKKSEPKKKKESSKTLPMLIAVLLIALLGGGFVFVQFFGLPWGDHTGTTTTVAQDAPHAPDTTGTTSKMPPETAPGVKVAAETATDSTAKTTAAATDMTTADTSATGADVAKTAINNKKGSAPKANTEMNKSVTITADNVTPVTAAPAASGTKAVAEPASPAETPAVKIAAAPAHNPGIRNNVAVTPKPAGIQPAPKQAPRRPVPKAPVKWPALKLKGIVGRGNAGSIILNSSIVGVGEDLDGVKIRAITSKGAWLEYRGEKKFLKVGKTIQ